MRATRTVVTPGRSNRVVGRIDSCLFPPSRGNEPYGNQSGKFRVRVPPCVPLRTCHELSLFGRDRDFGFRETRFRVRGAPPLSRRACFPFGAEREPLAHHRRRGTARAGPRESAAHARASAFALQEREALARLVKGCAWAGLDPADPRSVESRARRGCALGGLGACLSASLDRYRSAPTPHLARWRRASPTPRPWSGSRA